MKKVLKKFLKTLKYQKHFVYLQHNKKDLKPVLDYKGSIGTFFHKEIVDDYTFFKRAVGVFSASFLSKDYHLTDRELELFYCIFNFKTKGSGEIFSKSNLSAYFGPFESNKRVLQVWLPKLADKFWVKYTKTSVDILHSDLVEFLKKDKISFSVNYKRES